MREEIVYRNCPLCGEKKSESEFDFSHIYPRCCDNKKSVSGFSLEDVIEKKEIFKENGRAKGKYITQKGFGLYSICSDCNNYSGSHYTNGFKTFYKQGLKAYENQCSQIVDLSCKNIYPLRIIKEILMMFVIINYDKPLIGNFKNYLLNKENQVFPKDYNIYAYFTEDIYRFALHAESNVNGEIVFTTYSLISYKPFGFILTHKSEPSPKYNNICNIMAFNKYKYDDQESLVLPLRVINNSVPLSFTF
ncbi:MAG: hypothetical protein KAU01_01740 [Candidatus Cloacimonetes bacterium]|nr:hypothetical protein [Candidatus Cloacimonadota bacterium]